MADPVIAPLASHADDAKIVEAAHAYGLALAEHAAQKEACDAATECYEKERDAAHAELTTAAEAVSKAQAALLAASTGHPAVAAKANEHKEKVKEAVKSKGKR